MQSLTDRSVLGLEACLLFLCWSTTGIWACSATRFLKESMRLSSCAFCLSRSTRFLRSFAFTEPQNIFVCMSKGGIRSKQRYVAVPVRSPSLLLPNATSLTDGGMYNRFGP